MALFDLEKHHFEWCCQCIKAFQYRGRFLGGGPYQHMCPIGKSISDNQIEKARQKLKEYFVG